MEQIRQHKNSAVALLFINIMTSMFDENTHTPAGKVWAFMLAVQISGILGQQVGYSAKYLKKTWGSDLFLGKKVSSHRHTHRDFESKCKRVF